ncbi:putative exosome complex subunit Rrp46 [Aspergillus candidus]|uniref:Exosome complex subunit Rrp46 n=1 Tax=Aspergillus candidus TaxID=41067 RepID=A0A2I2FPP5_ASPCN|nr:hypothetical protein BDW47DRAFT_97500 [Aspergillus candidus]PLB42613.1 hypothetical protein BDW47DRAFT_97500 [Aspergillus candidus]
MVGPNVTLTPLSRADGSASYQCPSTGSNILGSVNAPVELPGRRDALKPEEATVEVFVKPGTAPAGVGERYVEGIIKTMISRLILGREKGYPRRGVVITLAIVGGQSARRGDSYLTLLPALLNTSLLALLSASVPMSMTFSATSLAVTSTGDILREPTAEVASSAASVHVLAFSSKGHLLLNESQGAFDLDTWDNVRERALAICRGTASYGSDGDVTMTVDVDGQPLEGTIREAVEDQVHRDYAWSIDAV